MEPQPSNKNQSSNQPQPQTPQQSEPPAQPTAYDTQAQPANGYPQATEQQMNENPEKSYLVALVLSYLLGSIGADRFYLNKIGTGILKLVTLGGLGIWHLVDMLLIAFNKLHAKEDDRPLQGYAHNRHWVKILAIILLIFNVVIILGIMIFLVLSTTIGIEQKSRDVERKTDINSLQVQLESYYVDNGQYLSATEINSTNFRSSQLPTVSPGMFKDPQSSESTFGSTASRDGYGYEASPVGCNDQVVTCTAYTLSALLEDGSTYAKSNLN